MEDFQTIIKEMELSGYECIVVNNERVWDEMLKAHTLTGFSLIVTARNRSARIWKHPHQVRVQVVIPFVGRHQITKRYSTKSLDDAFEWLQKELKK